MTRSPLHADLRLALAAGVTSLLSGCALVPAAWAPSRMEWIRVAPEEARFEQAPSGQPFFAWGFNYSRANRPLEDVWESEWPELVQDFAEMKALGANVVRIHLQLGKFLHDPRTPNEEALDRLERVVAQAEDVGLYLDVTGLGAYREADTPDWYFTLEEEERWAAHAAFWEAVAGRLAGSPAVFCYDLMNEPVVPSARIEPERLFPGEFGGYHFIQSITLDGAGRPREEIARAWLRRLTAAIRRHDTRHLITLGALPSVPDLGHFSGFTPALLAEELDFVSVHVYPKEEKPAEAVEVVRGFVTRKPLLIEETYPLHAGAQTFERFFHQANELVAGWLGFYSGNSPADVAEPEDIPEAIERDWLELFQRLGPRVAPRAE